MKLLEIQSPLRAESVDSITLGKSFIDARQSDDMSIFVDTLNVWHERLPEVGFEGAGAKDNVPKHEAITQSESRSWECIQSLVQPSRSAGQIVLLDGAGNNVGVLAPLCTVKRATLRIILPDDIAHYICNAMESDDTSVPVIFGTRISEALDRVSSVEPGAGNLGPSQLVIQFRKSQMGRENPVTPIAAYTFGECEIDFAKMTARRAGKPVAVTTLEFKLLKYFVDNSERVLSRTELLDEVWGYSCYPTTRTVDSLILKLRQKLEPNPAKPRHLHTVYGAGYKFVP
jgi:DNA-binding response OmpR family regulator